MSAASEPRSRAAAPLLVGTLIGSMVAGRIESALLCLALALAIAVALRAAWPSWRWRLALLSSAAIGWALNLYLTPGQPLPGAGPPWFGRVPTREGLELGALLTARLAGAMVSIQGLRAAWPGEQAADAVARLLAPLERLKVPVREMRLVMGLAVRFAPLVANEARRIARIQDVRAGRAPRGPTEWLTRRRAAAVPTMVASLERAERTALALEARGYRLRPLPATSLGVAAAAWALAGAAVAAAALLWRG